MKIIHPSLKEVVTERLRQAIFEAHCKPGTHLAEQTLADQYGVSRGPVREALLQLEQEGLVRILPRRGAVVTEISPREAWEIYSLRGHLEGLAVRDAATRWQAAHSQALAGLLADMERLGPSDWFDAIALDQQFHHVIVEAAGNRTLAQVYQTLDSKVAACFLAVRRYLGDGPPAMADRHRRLVAALSKGDFWLAETLAASHWSETGTRFRSLVEAAR